MQVGHCVNQMDTKFWEVVCNESGIGGGSEYCGDNDAELDRISVFYHVIGAATPSRRSASSSARETP
jgi:hypothetical protein